jgi:hypothetical protein
MDGITYELQRLIFFPCPDPPNLPQIFLLGFLKKLCIYSALKSKMAALTSD